MKNIEVPLTKHTKTGIIETTIFVPKIWLKHSQSKNQETMFKYLDLLDNRVRTHHRAAIRIVYNHILDEIYSYETR